MVINHVRIDASPGEVFNRIASGWSYTDWVLGARVRHVEEGWPRPASRLHHTFGIGMLAVDDTTTVVDNDPPNRLVLDARARPFGTARVELEVEPDGEGARVVLRETVHDVPPLLRPPVESLLWLRNAEALRRLREICETAPVPPLDSPGP